MKLKALKTFRHGSTNFKRGTSLELSEAGAKDLIARGYAEAAVTAKSADDGQRKPADPLDHDQNGRKGGVKKAD